MKVYPPLRQLSSGEEREKAESVPFVTPSANFRSRYGFEVSEEFACCFTVPKVPQLFACESGASARVLFGL